jgi:hypothetical protein
MTRKPSPKETTEATERSAEADEANRILALGDEELEREMAAAGLDRESASEAAAAARQKALQTVDAWRGRDTERSERRRTTMRPQRRRKPQNVLWVAVGAVAAAYLLFFVVPRLSPATPILHPRVPAPPSTDRVAPSLSELERAAALRRVALGACAEQRWQPCLEGLDDARRIDPAGEGDPTVRIARESAMLELGQRVDDAGR